MQISVESNPKNPAKTLVVFTQTSTKGKDKTLKVDSSVDKETKTLLQDAFDDKSFSSAKGASLYFRNASVSGYDHLLAIGLGNDSDLDAEVLRSAGGSLYKSLSTIKAPSADILLDSAVKTAKTAPMQVQALAEGINLSSYKFDEYKDVDNKKKPKPTPNSVRFLSGKKASTAVAKKAATYGVTLTDCVNFSKNLGDTPGNLMTPDILAKRIQKAAKGTGLKVTVWDKARIKKERFGGLLGVNLGGGPDPRFIIMEYKGGAASKKPLAFVGKGLTFDAGGISIKPSAGMDEMKYDMCGGANVIGTMLAIAKLKLKTNVVGYVPSTENMLGPMANKPGDILKFRNGKTAHVDNTDAEGRLILADALSYASEKKPAAIVDAATLTGACVIALGNSHTGIMGRDDKMVKMVQDAAQTTGEKVWQLPLIEDHLNDMKGTYADLSNISSFRGAGSSTAGAFLSHFVEKDIPWVHCDIAGTAWNCGNRLSYAPSKGATGSMIRTFVELARTFKA
ncbi:MAG: leucyl aminopeptidase [Bdellovibrionaceae bacterium]|nr:leucyl aminopeptidase [Pseudobdellovibrionaceae bacterium]